MKLLRFSYDKSGSPTYEIMSILASLTPEIAKVAAAMTQGYTTPYSFVCLPSDEDIIVSVQAAVKAKKSLQPDLLVLVGIGGSNLGTLAVHELLHGTFYNLQNPALQFYCADTIENGYTQDLLTVIEHALQAGKKVLVTIVSKSGTTTETSVNAALIYNLIARYYPHDAHDYVLVITDHASVLWHIAQEKRFTCLEIPRAVGGRYSVLSPVGLFPLAMMDIDITALRKGAYDALVANQQLNDTNWAAVSAAALYLAMLQGVTIHDTFIFSPRGFSLGLWYRQLMAESLGKRTTRSGEPISLGITPTVSIGTTDLHSMAQLYVAGLRDKITTMIALESDVQISLPTSPFLAHTDLAGKQVDDVQQAIMQAISITYEREKRPYLLWQMPDKNPYALGQFLYTKMLEVVYLGYLMEVDPFNQPEVELYKQETRRILAQ